MKTYLLEEWGGKVTWSPEGDRLVLRELEPRDSATISRLTCDQDTQGVKGDSRKR